jgi:hypothetical protein
VPTLHVGGLRQSMVFAESRLLTADSYFHQSPGKLSGQEKHCPWGKYALPCLSSIAGLSLIKSLVAGTSGKN